MDQVTAQRDGAGGDGITGVGDQHGDMSVLARRLDAQAGEHLGVKERDGRPLGRTGDHVHTIVLGGEVEVVHAVLGCRDRGRDDSAEGVGAVRAPQPQLAGVGVAPAHPDTAARVCGGCDLLLDPRARRQLPSVERRRCTKTALFVPSSPRRQRSCCRRRCRDFSCRPCGSPPGNGSSPSRRADAAATACRSRTRARGSRLPTHHATRTRSRSSADFPASFQPSSVTLAPFPTLLAGRPGRRRHAPVPARSPTRPEPACRCA